MVNDELNNATERYARDAGRAAPQPRRARRAPEQGLACQPICVRSAALRTDVREFRDVVFEDVGVENHSVYICMYVYIHIHIHKYVYIHIIITPILYYINVHITYIDVNVHITPLSYHRYI